MNICVFHTLALDQGAESMPMSIAAIVIGLSGLVFSIVTFAVGVVTGVVLTRSCFTKSMATLNDADMYEDMGGTGVGRAVVGGAGVGGAGVTNAPAVYEDVSLHPLEGPTNDIMLIPNDAYGHTRGIIMRIKTYLCSAHPSLNCVLRITMSLFYKVCI